MSADLSDIQVPTGKKGGRNRRRKHDEERMSGSDGEGESRVKTPGSEYFKQLYEKPMIQVGEHLAVMDSGNYGYTRNCSKTVVHRILYNRGYGNAKEMKNATGEVTMAKAFVQDQTDENVFDMPGPNMKQAREGYNKFLQAQYPDIWQMYDDAFWAEEEEKAFQVFKDAYTTWMSHNDAKSDGAAADGKRSKKQLPMAKAVEAPVEAPGAADGSVKVKKEQVVPEDDEVQFVPKNSENRAARREQGKLLPSSEVVDLTDD
jgi:hypothetical protein